MSTTSLPDGGVDGDNWEDVARRLLVEELERVALGDLRDAFIGAASCIEAGEELTAEDISDLREAVEDAGRVVETAAEASPRASPAPDLWDFLDEDARAEYVREADPARDTRDE